MRRERGNLLFFRNIILGIVFFQFFVVFCSALSVSPASTYIDFVPGGKHTLDYHISGTKSDRTYELYLKGDLAEYAALSKNKLGGDGAFKVFLSLPNSFEIPGKHILYVGVKEAIDEELGGGMIGTAVEIIVLVSVYVPYPGKYVEISFSSENVNVGESLEFNLEAINRGKENVIMLPKIEIFSNQSKEKTLNLTSSLTSQSKEKVETLYFEDRELVATQKLQLHKMLNTSSYNPGRYNARAIVEYGGDSPASAETFFRIGDLLIDIKNYTNKFFLDGKVQKFNIEIESGWNDKIDGVYADVVFLNKTSEVLSFKTSSSGLSPWESRVITGYFDTADFEEGEYDANITLFYYGKDVGRSSSQVVKVEFVKKTYSLVMIILISAGVLVLIGLVVLAIFLIKRKEHRKK